LTVGREQLSKAETLTVAAIESGVAVLVEAREVIGEFQGIIRRKALADLDAWVGRARRSLVAAFAKDNLRDLERGRRINAVLLRAAMESAVDDSDASGTWDLEDRLRRLRGRERLVPGKFGPAIRAKAASPAAMLPMLARVAGLLPTHTRRSEESQAFQQFSTPIARGLAASAAAAIIGAIIDRSEAPPIFGHKDIGNALLPHVGSKTCRYAVPRWVSGMRAWAA
jgi:hypothetical protein